MDNPTNPGEGLSVPATGTVTNVGVKTGVSAWSGVFGTFGAGQVRVEVLRARRTSFSVPGSVPDTVCCDVVGESQIFTPAPTGITQVAVNLPVTNEIIAGVENLDILALTVGAGGQVPGHDTFNYNAGEGPSAGLFYPHVNLGEQNRSLGGVGGVQLLMNADFAPAAGGGGGGNEFSVGGPNGLRLPVTVPGPGQVGVRDANDTIGRDLYIQAVEEGDLDVSRNHKKKLGLKPTGVTATGPGTFTVQLKLAGKAKKKYKRGKIAKVTAAVSFTPDGGTGSTQNLTLKLKK